MPYFAPPVEKQLSISRMEKELTLRKQRLKAILREKQVEACLITTPVNFLYTTGRVINGFHYIPAEGEDRLFVKKPAGLNSDRISYIRKPEEIPFRLKDAEIPLPETLLVEGGEIPYSDWL
jgi:Xaa-Pro aminopeptidase